MNKPDPASDSSHASAPPADARDNAASKRGSVRALMALNFCIADVQNGMGPYIALFLQSAVGWNPAQIGAALAAGNLAQVVAQTPAGALIDRLRQKRALLITGIVMIATACLATVWLTSLPVVTAAQALIGVAGAIFPPCLAAVALGLVGRKRMDRQMGTNQAFNAGGNMFAALALGAIGYYWGMKWMFYLVGGLCAAAALCVSFIRADDIDYDLARGADGESPQKLAQQVQGSVLDGIKDLLKGFAEIFQQRPVIVFLVSAVIFHFANAAMVPLVTEMLAKNAGAQKAILYTSGYMLASQFVFVVVAALSGRLAGKIGRKPLFLFAFAALAARGALYTLSHRPAALIAVQCMDGLGAGIFGVVGVLIVADLTKGTGRFNAAQGAIATAQGCGAFLSNSVAGYLAKRMGNNFTFLTLAGIAVAGLAFFWLLMPETREQAQDARDDEARSGPAAGDPNAVAAV
jgi:predicted MFS family arabinose efflux permease